MNQEYTDICSRCQRPCIRLRQLVRGGVARFVTSCCWSSPVAVRKET